MSMIGWKYKPSCIHQAPAMYCGACAPEKLEKALDLIEQAQWMGMDDARDAGCPWCNVWRSGDAASDKHLAYCEAAKFMGWERRQP